MKIKHYGKFCRTYINIYLGLFYYHLSENKKYWGKWFKYLNQEVREKRKMDKPKDTRKKSIIYIMAKQCNKKQKKMQKIFKN